METSIRQMKIITFVENHTVRKFVPHEKRHTFRRTTKTVLLVEDHTAKIFPKRTHMWKRTRLSSLFFFFSVLEGNIYG